MMRRRNCTLSPASRHGVLRLLRVALSSATLAVYVYAQAEEAQEHMRDSADESAPRFTLYFENDGVSGSDRHYTNGLKLSWLSADLDSWGEDGWHRKVLKALPLVNRPGRRKNFGFAFGQNIYTPQDISRVPPDPNDRPYAGWSYFEFTASSKSRTRMDTLSLQVGIVGPHSYAEDVQRWVHEWLNEERPAGWDYQLPDELGVNLVYEHKTRIYARTRRNLFGADLVPHVGISLGNVQTYANAGAIARIGFNLPTDFGIDLIRAAGGGGPIDGEELRERRRGSSSFFLFGGVDGRAVARDIFLDGSTFRDDTPRVDRETLVGDAYYGAGVIFGRWQITYTRVARSPEFKTQVGRSSFGSLTVSCAW